jgi:Dienelactone hydrolase family
MKRLGLLLLLPALLLACAPTPPGAEPIHEVVEAARTLPTTLLGVMVTDPSVSSSARRVFDRARSDLAPENAMLYAPRRQELNPLLAFVEDISRYDALIVVAPTGSEPWPQMTEAMAKRFRAKGEDVEEPLFHLREEFIHWKTFYRQVKAIDLQNGATAAVYAPNRGELQRLQALHSGRGPGYYAGILERAAAKLTLPESPDARRALLSELLRVPATPGAALEVWAGPIEPGDGYRVQQLTFQAPTHGTVEARLLLPEQADKPAAAVLALHGHSGLPEDFLRRFSGEDLARQGMIVLAPAMPGSGKDLVPEEALAAEAIAAGTSLMALRVDLAQWLLAYLATRPEVDARRMGIMGHSMGGVVALFAGALDPRIGVVASDLKEVMLETLTRDNPAVAIYVPGLLRLKDWSTLYEMIAPRSVYQSPYGYPDKPELVRFLKSRLENPGPATAWKRPIKNLTAPPAIRRTLRETLRDLVRTAKRPAPLDPGVDRVPVPDGGFVLEGDTCRGDFLGDVRFWEFSPAGKPTDYAALRTRPDRQAADLSLAQALTERGLAVTVFDATDGHNDIEDPLKLLAAGFAPAAVEVRKVILCRAALIAAGRADNRPLTLFAHAADGLTAATIVATCPEFDALVTEAGAFHTAVSPAIPGLAPAQRSWLEKRPAWLQVVSDLSTGNSEN